MQRPLDMLMQEGSQKFWELWGLYNIHGFNLDGVYLQAAVRQVGKVGRCCRS